MASRLLLLSQATRNPFTSSSFRLWNHPSASSLSSSLLPFQSIRSFSSSTHSSTSSVNFNDPTLAYEKKTEEELFRAYLVFKLCGNPFFVRNAEKLLNFSRTIFGDHITYFIIKKTFFAHFCAGETEQEIKPVMERLQSLGIGGILDYAAESDIASPTTSSSSSPSSPPPDSSEPSSTFNDETSLTNRIIEDHHRDKEGVISARTFDYAGEAECDKNANIFLRSIAAVAEIPNSFAAIKITALGKASLLERLSVILLAIRQLFLNKFAKTPGTKVAISEFRKGLAELGIVLSTESEERLFSKFDTQSDGTIDYIEWTQNLQLEEMTTRKLFQRSGYNLSSITRGGALPLLSEEDTVLFDNMVRRVSKVAEAAAKAKVRLMIDAEQTYLQPAIDHFVLNLQRKYNKEFPTIFNTYQCYLTWSRQHLLNDLERSKREKWIFAGKLVRGAYMVVERKRAELLNIPSPILPDVEATHENYNWCLSRVISEIHRANVIIASHNQQSIELTLSLMKNHQAEEQVKDRVFFGQLLGMSDHISFPLGVTGYKVYKYIPWGPVHEVVPYLLRRVQENSSLLGNAPKELEMITAEFERRVINSS